MKYIWVTLNDREALSVIVHANTSEEAKQKVARQVNGSIVQGEEENIDYMDDYGTDWFVQDLAKEEIK